MIKMCDIRKYHDVDPAEIQKMKEGFYYFIHFEAAAECPAEVESHIRIMESVIRYLCVKQEA